MLYDPDDTEDDELKIREDASNNSGGGYRELKVYHLAHELGVAVHKMTLRLPKHELYETGSQLRRASKSVSANIVEGYGRRRYKADDIRFLVYARASLDETEEHLRYIHDCYPEETEAATLTNFANNLGRRLTRYLD